MQPSDEFGAEARVIASNMNAPRKGADHGDHPPITPMKLMSKSEALTYLHIRIILICISYLQLVTIVITTRGVCTTTSVAISSARYRTICAIARPQPN